MVEIKLSHVSRRYRSAPALSDVTLALAPGQITAVLGPSGAGKTTLVELIAGLEAPDSGEIWFDSTLMSSRTCCVSPRTRHLGVVFQTLALWPHMTVWENVEFVLLDRGCRRPERRQRVEEALALARIGNLRDRYPHELSGGERQRAAIARAMAPAPSVLLLDEPLSDLDRVLRHELRAEILALHERVRPTTLYVTHEQEDAFAIADTVVILHQGKVAQVGTGEEIVRRPHSRFVARFTGCPNLIEATAVEGAVAAFPFGSLPVRSMPGLQTASLTVAIRPETIALGTGQEGIEGVVLGCRFMGGRYEVEVESAGVRLMAQADRPAEPGERVTWALREPAVVVADDGPETRSQQGSTSLTGR